MTPLDLLIIAATVAVSVPVFALAGVGGGYLISKAELFQDAQAKWGRAAIVLDAFLHGELATFPVRWEQELAREAAEPGYEADESVMPWGMVAIDSKVLPDPEAELTPKLRRRLWWRWARYALLRCPICVGWHAMEAVMLLAAGVAIIAGGVPWWAAVVVWPIVWLAAGALHTRWTDRWFV